MTYVLYILYNTALHFLEASFVKNINFSGIPPIQTLTLRDRA